MMFAIFRSGMSTPEMLSLSSNDRPRHQRCFGAAQKLKSPRSQGSLLAADSTYQYLLVNKVDVHEDRKRHDHRRAGAAIRPPQVADGNHRSVDLMITAIALEFADAVSTRDRAHFNFSGIVVAS